MDYLSNEFLIKLLIFILIFAIAFPLIRRTLFKEKVLAGIIALAISLIASFYISPSQLDFITSTYGMTGFLLIMLVPYIILFYFLYNSKITGIFRKSAWILIGIFTFIFFQNNSSITEQIKTNLLTITSVIIILIVIFDNKIKNYFNTRKNLS